MEKIKVLLSDPQVLFREGIHFTLSGEEDFEVTGETTSNEEALTFIEANPPNIAILNMKNVKLNGPSVTRRIKRNFPSVSVMLVADIEDEEQLFLATRCGASALLTKDCSPDYLLDLIRVVAQGSQPIIESLLIPGMASRILEEFEAISPLSEQLDNVLARLSPREAEILGSITAGNGIEQIATSLSSNEETIRRHLRAIVNKLLANDQAQAVIEAAQRGLPSILPGAASGSNSTAGYVTKTEFDEFKESLMQRFKSFITESA
ncbi:response regulator [Chloroflexota bacterium]